MTRRDGNMALLLHKVLQLLWKEINKEASFHVFNLYITEKNTLPEEKQYLKLLPTFDLSSCQVFYIRYWIFFHFHIHKSGEIIHTK